MATTNSIPPLQGVPNARGNVTTTRRVTREPGTVTSVLLGREGTNVGSVCMLPLIIDFCWPLVTCFLGDSKHRNSFLLKMCRSFERMFDT